MQHSDLLAMSRSIVSHGAARHALQIQARRWQTRTSAGICAKNLTANMHAIFRCSRSTILSHAVSLSPILPPSLVLAPSCVPQKRQPPKALVPPHKHNNQHPPQLRVCSPSPPPRIESHSIAPYIASLPHHGSDPHVALSLLQPLHLEQPPRLLCDLNPSLPHAPGEHAGRQQLGNT